MKGVAYRSELPPGQRARTDFPRFGLPGYAEFRRRKGDPATIRIGGATGAAVTLSLEDLRTLPRIVRTSDFHCVTTWSAIGVRWGGYLFSDVYRRLIEPRFGTGAEWVVFRGLDGYRTSMLLSDALANNVLLADALDGKPLTLEHGSPWRIVAPDHYGYKSVKHLAAVDFSPVFLPGPGPNEHPRGRVRLEERGRIGPGWILRRAYRPLVGRVIDQMAVRNQALPDSSDADKTAPDVRNRWRSSH